MAEQYSMKKLLRISPTLLAFLSLVLLFPKPIRHHSLSRNVEEETEREDGMQRALFQEFLMTRDPALNEIPAERIIEAKKRMEQIEVSNRNLRTAQTATVSWQERGPNNIGGRTRAILIDKNDVTGNTVWAAGIDGGLWKTTNFKSGATWTKVDDFFGNLSITCIAQDPNNPSNIYFGTGEGWFNIDAVRGLGIWKSSNGGANWSQLASTNNSTFYYIEKIAVNSTGIVFAATRNGGLRLSSDGGSTWTVSLSNGVNGGSSTRTADVEIGADGNVYCSFGIFSSDGIYRSSNSGSSWTKIYTSASNEYRIELACAPSNADVVYALIHGSTDDGIKKIISTSNATAATPTWSALTTPTWCDQGSTSSDFTRNQAWYDLIAAVDPNNDQVVYIGGVDVLKTTNGGSTWSQVSQWASGCGGLPNMHADIHSIQFFGTSSTELVIGNDGGIYYTTNGGTSFTKKNTGYNVTQYYSVAVSPTSGSNRMIGGAQDNGSHLFNSLGINAVSTLSGGDGGFCFIDQTNSSVWITSYTGSIYHLFRGNGVYYGSTDGSDGGRFINPADYDNVSNVLYYGASNGAYGYIDNVESGAASFVSFDISAAMGARQVSAVKADPNNAGTVWLGCSAPESGGSIAPNLVKVTSANTNSPSATAYSGPSLAVNSYISSIDIETGNSNHMLLTVSNYGVASVWESVDGGVNWNSLDNNGVNLPDMPIRWGMFIPAGYTARTAAPAAVGGIMLATELGVWSAGTTNGTSTAWVANNTGLANVRVDQLVVRNSDKLVAAATHGRGVFTALLLTPVLPVVLADFDGRLQQNNILLEWSTSSEMNSSHFELEKSFDKQNFRKIARITAAGNSNSLEEYSYLDKEPPSELNYYRLKMVDGEGHSLYSDIKLIQNDKLAQTVYVLGNPFNDVINLRFAKTPQTDVRIKLLNTEGKILSTFQYQQLSQSQISLPTNKPDLIAGVYLLRIEADNRTFNRQVVKR
jgi:hypothetical protein